MLPRVYRKWPSGEGWDDVSQFSWAMGSSSEVFASLLFGLLGRADQMFVHFSQRVTARRASAAG